MNGSHQRPTPEGGEHVPSGAAGGVVSTWARGEDGARGHDAAPTQPQAWDWNRAGYDRPGHPQDQSSGPQHGQRDPWATPGGPTPPGGGGDDHGRGGGGGRGPRRSPGWFGVAGAAIASALAASALTGALVGGFDDTAGTAATTSTSSGSTRVQGVSETTVNWQAVVSAVAPSVVAVTVQGASGSAEGSGIVYDTAGHVVTNNHVVAGLGSGATITVTLDDGRQYEATIRGTDPATDLAVIQLTDPPADLVAATFADSDDVVAGQAVMALGNPLGLSGSATTGIVSALDRPVLTSAEEQAPSQSPFGQQPTTGETAATNAIQTDAAINPGNSGGALLDSSGKVIGVNSSIASLSSASSSSQSGSIGLGFAIPSNEVRMIADQLVESGTAQHAWLGVSLAEQPASVTVGDVTREGAQVAAVTDGAPAAGAGVRAGDVVTAVDGRTVDGYESLTATIRGKAVGSTVELTVVRDGAEQTLRVTLAARAEG
ncbi:putative serine protease PepD [Kineococcus radiotolerans]|uniref:Putative serine protease PepD n=1 Tax=Kineococcus radiotolerans TaxID=131568 RepID=A0A7W4XXB4_KINRA|nr:trypsin-like peptidase domain-containing protein [Kineococcus radiotolerans]MBB2901936.1 putative serine protease PepD [Kineococcus radiotolerans]